MSSQSSSKTSGASSMAELMSRQKASAPTIKKGDIVKGIITKLTPSEILVDIDAKTDAFVLEKDRKILKQLLSVVKLGDTVSVSVLSVESEMGYPVVSMRRFLGDHMWETLGKLRTEKTILPVTIDGITRGGFLVTTKEGLSGFMPNSQVSFKDNPKDVIGKRIDAIVLEANKQTEKVIFSQKAINLAADFDKAIKLLKPGQKVMATVSHVTPFGVFLSIPLSAAADGVEATFIDGLAHVSELSWEKMENVEEHFTVGEEQEVSIIGFDKEAKRIDLSIKRLTADPFQEKMKAFSVDQKVKGTVTKVNDAGVILELAGGIEGILKKEKIPANVTYAVGQEMQVTITDIDTKRHRVSVSPVLVAKPLGYR